MPDSKARIEEILRREFAPTHLEIIDDSDRHKGHAGPQEFGGGHFSIVMVSEAFRGKSLVDQHRAVNTALRDLFGRDIHALALKTFDPDTFAAKT